MVCADRRYLVLQQNHTRVSEDRMWWAWWRQKVSFMYAHNVCPHSTHAFERLQSRVTKPTNTEYTPLTWETQKFVFIFVQIPSIGQLSQQALHSFDGTALQQQLQKFSANIYSTHALTTVHIFKNGAVLRKPFPLLHRKRNSDMHKHSHGSPKCSSGRHKRSSRKTVNAAPKDANAACEKP